MILHVQDLIPEFVLPRTDTEIAASYLQAAAVLKLVTPTRKRKQRDTQLNAATLIRHIRKYRKELNK